MAGERQYIRLMIPETYDSQQITMLRPDPEHEEEEILKLVELTEGRTCCIEVWESESLGEEKREDGGDKYRLHKVISSRIYNLH